MDLAYDHIAEESFVPADRATTPTPAASSGTEASDNAATPRADPSRQNLQTEFQETFKAFSNSPWGAKLGGLWGNVKKQGETYYEEARKEAAEVASEVEALRTKGLLGLAFGKEKTKQEGESSEDPSTDGNKAQRAEDEQKKDLQETETFLARFKIEAAKRLKDVQKAEDAADEALLRFGTNIRNFLRDAVAVSAPDEQQPGNRQPGEVLFESRDPTSGKRVIHTSRFDAQLHVIHTTLTSFTQDPSGAGGQWEDFKREFDIDKMTTRIAEDLDKYSELRNSMEKVVPETVDYKDFWTRYYFLRHVVEVQEEKRKELLQGWCSSTTPKLTFYPWIANTLFQQRQPTRPKKSAGTRTLKTSKNLRLRHNSSRRRSLHQQSWSLKIRTTLRPPSTQRPLLRIPAPSSPRSPVADRTTRSRLQTVMPATT